MNVRHALGWTFQGGFTYIELIAVVSLISALTLLLNSTLGPMKDFYYRQETSSQVTAIIASAEEARSARTQIGVDAYGNYIFAAGPRLPAGSSIADLNAMIADDTPFESNPFGLAYTVEVTNLSTTVVTRIPGNYAGWKYATNSVYDAVNNQTVLTFYGQSTTSVAALRVKEFYLEPTQ